MLINNAGAILGERQVTEDGLELTFATNHMSYFVLTHGLRDSLVAAGSARVVNTSSHAHHSRRHRLRRPAIHARLQIVSGVLPLETVQFLFTRVLARRLAGTGVTANSLHPGFVKTRFGDNARSGWMARVIGALKIFAISQEKGAETIIYLASSDDVAKTTGLYFYKCKSVAPSKVAQDDAVAERLWKETAKLAGIKE